MTSPIDRHPSPLWGRAGEGGSRLRSGHTPPHEGGEFARRLAKGSSHDAGRPQRAPPVLAAPLLLPGAQDHRAWRAQSISPRACSGTCEPHMAKERLYLFDTTLRDGAQTTGVDFSLEDKRLIARTLDQLGVDYIEGGYPGANPTDTELFSADPGLANATFTAFGMTKRSGRSLANDPGFQATLQAKAGAICLVAKAWDYHVRVALGISNEENLEGVAQSVEAVAKAGREPMIDCEHFFDGYKGNRAYALAVATTAYKAGARWVVLCDTNGGTLPHEIAEIVAEVVEPRAGHAPRHPHPQRHRECGRQYAGRRARRRAPDPGRAQRAGRALRQCQPHVADPDPGAQARIRRALRDAGDAGAPEEAHPCEPSARRAAQSRPRAPGALRRRGGVRHQGRHPRLRHPEGAGDLRARASRSPSATAAACWCPTRPASRT